MSGQPERPEAETDQQTGGTEDAEAIEPDADSALAELQRKADENWDRYLRAAAEVENVRKRAMRDVELAHKFALENFSRELLAVKDSLEMGLVAADSADAASLVEGSKATLKQLAQVFERFGIVEVQPLDEPFDPEAHEAMTTQPSTEAEPGTVLAVIQKGYLLNGRLLRPARVVVAAAPAESPGDDG